tara:strand:- start:277 stop:450 length:174 start_codon:yes stop_codon:yes gene_type:complete
MTQTKELYDETGKPGTIETNDFKYYMHLKKLKVSTKFNGKISDLIELKNDILTYLNK